MVSPYLLFVAIAIAAFAIVMSSAKPHGGDYDEDGHDDDSPEIRPCFGYCKPVGYLCGYSSSCCNKHCSPAPIPDDPLRKKCGYGYLNT